MRIIDTQQLPYDLIAGFDYRGKAMNVAVLDPDANHFPWTDDLHGFNSLRTLERFWWRRCHQRHWDEPAPRVLVAVAVAGVDPPTDLHQWWQSRGATVLSLQGVRLAPFVKEASNHSIPQRFHRAHALAQCAATRFRTHRDLDCLAQTLNEINFVLRQTEEALWRLAAAHSNGLKENPLPGTDNIDF